MVDESNDVFNQHYTAHDHDYENDPILLPCLRELSVQYVTIRASQPDRRRLDTEMLPDRKGKRPFGRPDKNTHAHNEKKNDSATG